MPDNQPARPGADDNAFSIGILTPHLEGIPEAMQPYFEYGAKLQSEFLTLWSHRAQAWLNWPKQALACRTPADFVDAQGKFLNTMQRHYREYFDAVLQDTLLEPGELAEPAVQDKAEHAEPPPHREAA